MVRMRCGITEDEEAASALAKLRATLEEHVTDPAERSWVEPRLAHLLGLEEGVSGDQENLFSAWRVLFERLAEIDTVVLVFEDMQWADAGLLDFLDYLLDWSRNHPIFVLSLARPELAEKHPTWGAGKRAVTSLYLEPLPRQAMEDLLDGLVPGLPEELRSQILDRAEGVPLYAVETVRMLLDRGVLAHDGTAFRPTGPIETLEVPETLHALVAARLDGLSAEERRLVQGASVLGKTFTTQGIVALSGLPQAEVEPLLTALLRKEVLSIQADPRSPERGQYAFLQDIVKHVAYETLSKRERKEKHLAAAHYLATLWGGAEEDEIVEVVAAHYLDAWRAAPDAEDAEEIKGTAREMLIRAAERASSLGATAEAQRAYERALELTEDAITRAELHEHAGVEAASGARADDAIRHLDAAISGYEGADAAHPAARVSATRAEIMWERGKLADAIESLETSFEVLRGDEPDEALATLAAQLARFQFFAGDFDRAFERLEIALDLAEALLLPEVFSQALNTKSVMLQSRGRRQEAIVLVRHALEVALEADKPSAALRAYNNVADILNQADRYEEAAQVLADGLTLAHRVGNRQWERALVGQVWAHYCLGRWDEVIEHIPELLAEDFASARLPLSAMVCPATATLVHRGELQEAERVVERLAELETSADAQERGAIASGRARLLLGTGDLAEAFRLATDALELRAVLGISTEYMKELFVVAAEAAFELNDDAKVEQVLAVVEHLPPGRASQAHQAQASRFRARLAAQRGEVEEAERLFKRAAGLFREIASPFYLAVTQLEQGERLVAQRRAGEAEPLLAEAHETFVELGATPWLERLGRAAPAVAAAR
jgi:tetratricopeptide (TPR) repeat protein